MISMLTESTKFMVLAALSLAMVVTPALAFAQQAPAGPESNQAAAGAINLRQGAVEFLNDNLNATLFDAVETAESQVQNSTAVAGQLDAVEGYLAYNITVANTDSNVIYNVFVDPSNGKVISTSVGPSVNAVRLPVGFEDLNATLVDAMDLAEKKIQNSISIAGDFEPMQGGALVYSITVADLDNGVLYKIDIDAATGGITSVSEGTPIGDLGIRGIFGQSGEEAKTETGGGTP
jgi:uncharacterized membrane protein YkoI